MSTLPKIVIYYALYGLIASVVIASLVSSIPRLPEPVQPMNVAPSISVIRQV